MKNELAREKKLIAQEKRQSRRVFLLAALAVFVLQTQACPAEPSPGESVGRFFDLVLTGRVQEAADSAFFSDEHEKDRFVQQWTEKAQWLSGYTLEGWTIEPTKGWADVAVEFRDSRQDETLKIPLLKRNGVWKVAAQKDLKPDFPTSLIPAEIENLENLVHVTSKANRKRIELFVVNKAPFSVLFRLGMNLPASWKSDCPLPLEGILPPSKEPIPLCNLRVVGRSSRRYSWSYTVKRADDGGEMVAPGTWTPLPKVSVHEDARFFVGGKYAYGPPYPVGKGYLIWQGPGGSFSHNEPGSLYAVDFSTPIGSEITAARGGVVIAVVQKNRNNPDEKTAPAVMANEVLILHADGTMGVYAHLTTNGAKVSFGETVRRGQVLGLSGNSGYSRGPHLHFDVLGYKGRQCLSRPFGFLSADGTIITPRKGLILLAEKDGIARITSRETSPRRVIYKRHEKFDTEIRHFAKTVDFLARNKTKEVLGVELSFSQLENAVCRDTLPRRVALPADETFHDVLSLELIKLGERSAFAYLFRRVEPPGREHIPLRVERDAGDGYVIEIRYFSDRIEFYAENKSSRAMVGMLDFPSLSNLAPKEKVPARIRLPADASTHYLATLLIVRPTKGYSLTYNIRSRDER